MVINKRVKLNVILLKNISQKMVAARHIRVDVTVNGALMLEIISVLTSEYACGVRPITAEDTMYEARYLPLPCAMIPEFLIGTIFSSFPK